MHNFIFMFGGLNENVPPWLRYLNIRSTVGGTIWEALGVWLCWRKYAMGGWWVKRGLGFRCL